MEDNNTTRRVLVIDDNKDIHEDFRKILCSGCAVDAEFDQLEAMLLEDQAKVEAVEQIALDSAYQGQEGFEMVKQAQREGRPYCLAFVDIRMPPGWDGIETILKIWESDPEIQIVVCSAYSDYSWEEMVRQLGQSDRFLVLKKPFDSIEVRQFVAALSQRWHDARTDPLTGLLNRRAFQEHSESQSKLANRKGEPLACVMLDLDFFKRINDMHGHLAGDTVLRMVAQVLSDCSRPGDYVCRYGGEELCILLRGANEQEAEKWSMRVCEQIRNSAIEVNDKSIRVTGSFGVAERRDNSLSVEMLVDQADQALLVAKQSGRNRVVRFSTLGTSSCSTSESISSSVDLFQGVTAKDVMVQPKLLLKNLATLEESAAQLLRCKVSSAPIVDTAGKLVGIVSEKDLLIRSPTSNALHSTIDQLMETDVIFYDEDTPLEIIFNFLVRVAIHQVVIVKEQHPVGMISRGTLFRWLFSYGYARAHQSAVAVDIPEEISCLPVSN